MISRYISNPLLINSHKFDLRLYICVTSYEPLRAYIYKEGLARFASESYSTKAAKSNQYMHLTNYSINKDSADFQQNEGTSADDMATGSKWSLSALMAHLREKDGVDTAHVMERIKDIIVKTIISAEGEMTQMLGRLVPSAGAGGVCHSSTMRVAAARKSPPAPIRKLRPKCQISTISSTTCGRSGLVCFHHFQPP